MILNYINGGSSLQRCIGDLPSGQSKLDKALPGMQQGAGSGSGARSDKIKACRQVFCRTGGVNHGRIYKRSCTPHIRFRVQGIEPPGEGRKRTSTRPSTLLRPRARSLCMQGNEPNAVKAREHYSTNVEAYKEMVAKTLGSLKAQ